SERALEKSAPKPADRYSTLLVTLRVYQAARAVQLTSFNERAYAGPRDGRQATCSIRLEPPAGDGTAGGLWPSQLDHPGGRGQRSAFSGGAGGDGRAGRN